MEMVLSAAIGVLAASGIWLLLRPRTFQVIVGLCLLSYAVNLFIFAMGRLVIGGAPVIDHGTVDPALYADPVPQALQTRRYPPSRLSVAAPHLPQYRLVAFQLIRAAAWAACPRRWRG